MVQEMWPRNSGARSNSWETDRAVMRHQDARPHAQDGVGPRRPSVEIYRTIREQWRIPAAQFFLVVSLENGDMLYFSGPDQISDVSIPRFFSAERWLGEQRPGSGASGLVDDGEQDPPSDYLKRPATTDLSRSRAEERRRGSGFDTLEEEGLTYKSRKRPRPHAPRRPLPSLEDEAPIPTTSPHKGIKIGDSLELWVFYEQRFKNLQQTACKLIAKAWIRAVEPKKQSSHPYTGSDERSPGWWPATDGPDKVRHKEPDHLFKRERVYLLVHILRLVMESNRTQHLDIQKLCLTVAKLEEVAMEALHNFFGDKENPNNLKKKAYLKEIFKIAKTEERYRDGQIDGDWEVYVMADDKVQDTYLSDADKSSAAAKDKEIVNTGSNLQRPSPQRPALSHDVLVPPSTDQTPPAIMSSGENFSLPVRDAAPYPPQMMGPDLAASAEAQGYVETAHSAGGMVMPEQMLPPPPSSHEASRRSPAVFAAPADFTTPSTAAMYAPVLYATYPNPQAPPAHGAFVSQAGSIAMPQTPTTYFGPGYGDLPRPFDGNPAAAMFRHGSMSHSLLGPPPPTTPQQQQQQQQQQQEQHQHQHQHQQQQEQEQQQQQQQHAHHHQHQHQHPQSAYAAYIHGDGRNMATGGPNMDDMGRAHPSL